MSIDAKYRLRIFDHSSAMIALERDVTGHFGTLKEWAPTANDDATFIVTDHGLSPEHGAGVFWYNGPEGDHIALLGIEIQDDLPPTPPSGYRVDLELIS